jgi:hypothetical protein
MGSSGLPSIFQSLPSRTWAMAPQRQKHISQWVVMVSTFPGAGLELMARDRMTGTWEPRAPKVAALIFRNRLRERCSVMTSFQSTPGSERTRAPG